MHENSGWRKNTSLKDVISETKADTQIRCNQIWAVSMPFTMLDEEKERQIVDTVFERLYTPYGLRTLDPKDEEFHASYGGEMIKRDLAYHQGTVWTFPMGGYYLAYLKVIKIQEKQKRLWQSSWKCWKVQCVKDVLASSLKFMMERFRFLQKDVLHRRGV